jgi:hypothetical protein
MGFGLDSASAADRVRPGADNPCVKFTFTTGASAFQAIRPTPAALADKAPALYVSVKVTANCHVIFGDASLRAATTGDALFEPTDGWQDFMLLPGDTGFRVIGDTGGDLYVFASGR